LFNKILSTCSGSYFPIAYKATTKLKFWNICIDITFTVIYFFVLGKSAHKLALAIIWKERYLVRIDSHMAENIGHFHNVKTKFTLLFTGAIPAL